MFDDTPAGHDPKMQQCVLDFEVVDIITKYVFSTV